MRNFAVKFAMLMNRQVQASPQLVLPDGSDELSEQLVTPQELLDRHPLDMLDQLKQYLTERDRGVLFFGFSDQAIIDILDDDFEVDMDRNTLIFRRTYLDASSIRLAAGQRAYTLEDPEAEALIQHLSSWLLEASRSLYREELSELRVADIKAEHAIGLRQYAVRQTAAGMADGHADALHRLLASSKAMKAYLHSQTVDAIFKMDAAEVLFGKQSGYYQAWQRKQFFRNMISHCVENYIFQQAA